MKLDVTHGLVEVTLDNIIIQTRDAGATRFVGRAAVYNKRTPIGDPKTWGFWEQIAPGAFDRALAEDQDVVLLFNHNYDHVLARTSSGTMTLSSDKKGLVVEADIADTPTGLGVRTLLERRDLSKMSFGFIIPDPVNGQRWETLKDGSELRTVLDADLDDTSIVTRPAYKDTSAALRSAIEATRRASPLAHERRAAALAQFSKLSPPPGMTKKERNA